MMDVPLIYVIEDDAGLRAALGSLLQSVGYEVVLYKSTDGLLNENRVERPSCLILDVRLPGMSGLEFQAQLARRGIAVPIVLMTGFGDIPMAVRGMKAGAVEFLTKPFRDQDMLDAVAAAIESDRKLSSKNAGLAELRCCFETLSPRERQIMTLITKGKMNKQVASDLQLSEVTVKVHRGAAMRKMGARSLAALVVMAETLGLHSSV
jgi:FixJ family two-component response regulator